MARQRLTERTLSKPYSFDGPRLEIWDDLLPGFGVRITERGVKSFFVYTRLYGKPIRVTLGTYPLLALSDGRTKAREALQAAQQGEDPRKKKSAEAGTIDYLVDEFEKRHLSKLRPLSAKQATYYLRSRFLGRFSGRRTEEIKRGEIRALLDDIADEGKGITANRTLAAVRKMFSWAEERGEIEISPCHGLKAPAKEVQRTRFLDMDEVSLVWRASDALTPAYRALVRTLLLTGQRRRSVAEMQRSQIKDGVWTIPRENMKGDRVHSVPLSPLAQEIIHDAPRINDCDLVFTTDGRNPVSGFSKMKAQLDAEIDRIIEREEDEETKIAPWRLHDLRRTAGTHIARLGFPRLLVSKILGHSEGGVTQIYELYSYDDEKLRSLQAWSDEIKQRVGLAHDLEFA